ncbi:MAG: YkgJ family cysteine cluster protein [Myxococcota bacterium]
MSGALDCRACGACCCNPPANEAAGYRWYVEIDDPRSALLHKADLARWVVRDDDGVPHVRLDPSGRCAALIGRLGRQVTCRIYAHRPAGCRKVTAGDSECLAARAARGID